MIVVSNSGPLMALGKLGLLDLLVRLYGQIRMPTGVFTEVVVSGRERGSADAILVEMAIKRGQMVVIETNDVDLLPEIASLSLDLGEKQTLHLALRDKADLVLLDDMRAREEARARGMTLKGTLGVIVQGYRTGLLRFDELVTVIEAIMARDDIWISDGLCREVMARLKNPRSPE